MDLLTIETPALGNATHVIAGADGAAIIIDPPRDAWRISAAIAERGWRPTHVLETHVHNDYLSGALELRAAHGVEIVAPAAGGYAFAYRGLEDGDELVVDDVRVRARATPGHTPEHLTWDLGEADAPDDAPWAVATGGSLLAGSAGRTDLLGPERTDALTHAQARTLRGLATLPDATLVLPTHGAGSFCGVGPGGQDRVSTIGRERRDNPLLAPRTEDEWVAGVIAGYGSYPTYYREMGPLNRAGPAILGGPVHPAMTDGAAARASVASGARLVDARMRSAYAAGHVPGSLNVELGDTFGSYVGWFVPFGAPVVLLLPEPLSASVPEAVAQLVRIGYDRIAGVLVGGIDAWVAAGGELATYPTTTLTRLRQEAAGGRGYLLDVRDPREWREDGIVPGALRIPVGELTGRLAEVPRDAQVTVLCRSGARASVAASILDANDIDVRLVTVGGAPDLIPDDPGPDPGDPHRSDG
jgi:hydroxyacylglutathione hydrolase